MGALPPSSDDFSPLSEINVTPLVDVMLVLLVIFMVTAPLLESGISVQLPKASGKALLKGERPVVLHITKDRKFFIGKMPVETSALGPALREIYRKRSKKDIFIRADAMLPYGFVAQTMAFVRQLGIDQIGLVTVPPKSRKK